MSTPTEEITLDIAALDAAAGQTPDKQPPAADIQVEGAPETTPEPKKTEIPTEEGVEKLRKQLETEKAARIAAESHAREAAQGEVEARQTAQTSQLDLIKSAIDRVTQANDTLEAQYADAMAAQDFKGAAKAQRQMSDNSAKLAQLEAGKNALEKAPKPTPRAPVDPVESFASTLSPASASWVRAHPEYVRDPNKNRKMLAAHNIALADGATADTPEYFKSIEETLKIAPIIAKPREEPTEHDDPMADAARPANGGRQAAPVAPVTRSPTNGSGQRPGTIRLTPAQREAARYQFPDSKDPDKEYALNMMELIKEGKLS